MMKLQWIQDGTSYTILFAEKYAHCTSPSPPAYQYGGTCWAYSQFLQPGIQPVPMHPGFAIDWGGNSIGPGSLFLEGQPDLKNCDPSRASTYHTGGMQVALADGSARNLSHSIRGKTWWALCTPNGYEVINEDW